MFSRLDHCCLCLTLVETSNYSSENLFPQALSLLANAATSMASMSAASMEEFSEDSGDEHPDGELKALEGQGEKLSSGGCKEGAGKVAQRGGSVGLVEGTAVSDPGSAESKTESEGLLTIDETAQAQEQEGKL